MLSRCQYRSVLTATALTMLGVAAPLFGQLSSLPGRLQSRLTKSQSNITPSVSVIASGLSGDFDSDGDVDWHDYAQFRSCLTAPQSPAAPACANKNLDGDSDVDLRDFAAFARFFNPVPNPRNSSCFFPAAAADGGQEISNLGATTDGPDEPGQCEFYGRTQVESDIWFCYTATCTGQAVISLCGSSYDTKLAVYSGCGCPEPDSAIACSDDDCGSSVQNLQSRVTANVTVGQSYMIRVGGFAGDQGDGLLTISCGEPDACQTSTADCLLPSPDSTPGCADSECCQTTCGVDQFCCDVVWDGYCAATAEGLCDGSFFACEIATTSCGSISAEAGCSDESCCNNVCSRDPFCCLAEWDANCVEEAQALCSLTCNDRAGSCYTAHESPGCNIVACCDAICPDDPFCCTTEWDSNCADQAVDVCN